MQKKSWMLLALCMPFTVLANPSGPLRLPLAAKDLMPRAIEFSANGAQACLAASSVGADSGRTRGGIVLIDRAANKVVWEKSLPAPDGYADIFPVQCVFSGDAVYLLANVNTKSQQSLNQSLAYVYRFDVAGKQTGYVRLAPGGREQYGYAIGAAPNGVTVAGYTKDEDSENEYYAVFTQALDAALKPATASVRKTGAFDPGAAARFVGDSLYIGGNFSPAKLPKNDLADDYAAARLKLAGGYLWSVRPQPAKQRENRSAVGADGAVYALGYVKGTSTLATVGADGKAGPPVSYASKYCETAALAPYGGALLAVREMCRGQGKESALLRIDPAARQEQVLSWFPEAPVYVAASGAAWAAVARDSGGKLVFYSGSTQGER